MLILKPFLKWPDEVGDSGKDVWQAKTDFTSVNGPKSSWNLRLLPLMPLRWWWCHPLKLLPSSLLIMIIAARCFDCSESDDLWPAGLKNIYPTPSYTRGRGWGLWIIQIHPGCCSAHIKSLSVCAYGPECDRVLPRHIGDIWGSF